MTAQSEAIDLALSADALRQAAKQGEPAASVLLAYGEMNPSGVGGLAALFKRGLTFSSGECTDARVMRAAFARAMSLAALDAPQRRMRRTARAYLKKEQSSAEGPSIPTPTPGILLDFAYQHATRMLMQEPRELPPTWLIANGEGLVTIVVTPFGDDEEKDAVVAQMRKMMRDKNIVAYCHLAEAWMGKAASTVRPRDDPERIEIVTAMAYTATEDECAAWKIKRSANDLPIELELLERSKGASGRFSWLLTGSHEATRLSLETVIADVLRVRGGKVELRMGGAMTTIPGPAESDGFKALESGLYFLLLRRWEERGEVGIVAKPQHGASKAEIETMVQAMLDGQTNPDLHFLKFLRVDEGAFRVGDLEDLWA